MASKVVKFASVFSVGLCALTVVSLALSPFSDPTRHYLSLSDEFHMAVFRGRVAFFNDAEYGPYQGSIIGLVDADGNVYPPMQREIKWGDTLGVYYRYFKWADAKLWTLTISLLWPLAAFGLASVLCLVVRWRKRAGWCLRSTQTASQKWR